MQLLLAAGMYFSLTYLAGFLLGAARQIVVVPRTGQLIATLLELPLMLAISYFAARFVFGRFRQMRGLRDRVIIGGAAFALLIVTEIALSGVLRGWSLQQWVMNLKTPEGLVALTMFAAFACMPLIVRRI